MQIELTTEGKTRSDQIITATNLSTGEEITFSNVDAKYAVSYARCTEELNLTSWFLTHACNNTLDVAYEGLGLIETGKTVACGDWCAVTT